MLRQSEKEEIRDPKWYVFCVGEEKNEQRLYFEDLNISSDYIIEVIFVDVDELLPAGEVLTEPASIIDKWLTSKPRCAGYTVFFDRNDFTRDFVDPKKQSGGEARNFDVAIKQMDKHDNFPVFWSNYSFKVWKNPRDRVATIKSLSDEVAYAKKYYEQDEQLKQQDYLIRGRCSPSSEEIVNYSNGGKHMIYAQKVLEDWKQER